MPVANASTSTGIDGVEGEHYMEDDVTRLPQRAARRLPSVVTRRLPYNA